MTNKVRYQCASHHNGGDSACSVALSVLRERLEERVMDRIEFELLAPGRLADLEHIPYSRFRNQSEPEPSPCGPA